MATAITAVTACIPGVRYHRGESPSSESHPDHIISSKISPATISLAIAEDSTFAIPTLLKTTILRASPYVGPGHLLHLHTLETQSRLMALALSALSPAKPDYATADYEQAFHWNWVTTLLATLAKEQHVTWKKQSFYVVEFRSKLKENIDTDRLYLLDKQSHMEATASGGLLKYWYGSLDSERYNLATCLWRSKEDAVNGGRGPWHKQARAVIPQMYEMIHVKGLNLTIEDDIMGWEFST